MTAPATERDATTGTGAHWPVWKLSVLLYPFAAPAVAINLFMASLMGQAIGLPALPPLRAVVLSVILGIPAAWLAGRWVRSLLDQSAR